MSPGEVCDPRLLLAGDRLVRSHCRAGIWLRLPNRLACELPLPIRVHVRRFPPTQLARTRGIAVSAGWSCTCAQRDELAVQGRLDSCVKSGAPSYRSPCIPRPPRRQGRVPGTWPRPPRVAFGLNAPTGHPPPSGGDGTTDLSPFRPVYSGFGPSRTGRNRTRNGRIPSSHQGFVSAPERIRTSDLRFRRPTLYPAELRAQRTAMLASTRDRKFCGSWRRSLAPEPQRRPASCHQHETGRPPGLRTRPTERQNRTERPATCTPPSRDTLAP